MNSSRSARGKNATTDGEWCCVDRTSRFRRARDVSARWLDVRLVVRVHDRDERRVVGIALLLLDGIAPFGPVGPKVVRQDQHAQARETQLSQRFECRPEVWTVIEWAAPAVGDEVGRSRKALCPPPQVTEPLFGGRRAVQRCAWNVPVSIQKSRRRANDHGLVCSGGAREFMNEVSGPDRVRGRPRLSGTGQACGRRPAPRGPQPKESGRSRHRKRNGRP
jgi:hypothetical protein